MSNRSILFFILIASLLTACGGAPAAPTSDPNAVMTVAFATVNASGTQTALAVPTNTLPPPTETPIPTPAGFQPTVVLQATVIQAANCRFGPSATYAGPGAFRPGKILEAIGRDAGAQWILLREVGGKKSCWVYLPNLNVQGDINSLAVAPVELLLTPNYPAPANVRAARVGGQVQVTWDAVTVQLKDAYPDSSYFVEAWSCLGGQIVYSIFATKELFAVIPDQPGCAEASHALLYTTTKEGYSQPASIPWPAP